MGAWLCCFEPETNPQNSNKSEENTVTFNKDPNNISKETDNVSRPNHILSNNEKIEEVNLSEETKNIKNEPIFNLQAYILNETKKDNLSNKTNGTEQDYVSKTTQEVNSFKTALLHMIKTHQQNWEIDKNDEFIYTNLHRINSEYIKIQNIFLNTAKRNLLKIITIERIENPYLLGRYLLKKMQMKIICGKAIDEYLLFHGTNELNVNNISQNNFDWRKYGSNTGFSYGKGVSFSPISHYSTHYCDKGSDKKVVIVASVLLGNICIGNKNMTLPPLFDPIKKLCYVTSVKENHHVIVKYTDDEYYPAYKITFTVYNTNLYYKRRNVHF